MIKEERLATQLLTYHDAIEICKDNLHKIAEECSDILIVQQKIKNVEFILKDALAELQRTRNILRY